MENCIFCKIINGEIPCDKIYENNDFLAFLDIAPVSDGHLLIIPKKHVAWMQEADNTMVGDIFILAKKLMTAQKTSLGADYINVSVVGKDVPHFHVHLIPRMLNDNLLPWPTQKYKEGTAKSIAEKIISAL